MPSTMGDSRGGLAKPLRSYLVEFLGCISVIFVVVLIMSYSSVNAVNIANTQSGKRLKASSICSYYSNTVTIPAIYAI